MGSPGNNANNRFKAQARLRSLESGPESWAESGIFPWDPYPPSHAQLWETRETLVYFSWETLVYWVEIPREAPLQPLRAQIPMAYLPGTED